MKLIILLITVFFTSFVSAQTNQLQLLKDKKKFAIEAVTEGIYIKYVTDLKELLQVLTESENLDEAKMVEEEIALIENQRSINDSLENGPSIKFHEGYLIGTEWEYTAQGQKYIVAFNRRTFDIYSIDLRGRKMKQRVKDWIINSIEDREIITARGTVSGTLNKSLSEMDLGGNKLKLIKK